MASIKSSFITSPVAHVLIILILGGSLLLFRLGSRPLGGSEGRWGEAAREMLLTHDWIVPKINGIPYRDKPVGSYWLIALFSLPKNRVTETTTRLPSAAATILSTILLYLVASSFWDRKAALLTALIFMTHYPLLHWSRTANADTLTLTGMLGSVWFFVKHRHDIACGTWLYPFFIIAGLASLMKGLLGFVLPSLGVFPYLLAKNRRVFFSKRFLLHLFFAAILGGALFLVPFFLDFEATHSGVALYLVFKENIIRFFHPFDHMASFFYYFYYIFITLSPWTLMIPILLHALKKRDITGDNGFFFFTLWFACLFTFFTLSGSKRGYYLLPVIAPFSALLGFTLLRSSFSKAHSRLETVLWLIPATAAALFGIAFLVLPFTPLPEMFPRYVSVLQPLLCPLAGGLLLAGASIIMIVKHRFAKAFFLIFAGIYLFMGVYFWFATPAVASISPFVPFCKKVNAAIKNSPVAVYGSADRSILYFYLDKTPVPYFIDPKKARDFLYNHPRSFLIVKGRNSLDNLGIRSPKVVISERERDPKAYLLITLKRNSHLIKDNAPSKTQN